VRYSKASGNYCLCLSSCRYYRRNYLVLYRKLYHRSNF